MKVSVELSVIPIGTGVSISGYIAECYRILQEAGLVPEVGPHGTWVEGEWDHVFDAIRQCHEALHKDEVVRIFTEMKINTRTDKDQSARDKVDSVQSKL